MRYLICLMMVVLTNMIYAQPDLNSYKYQHLFVTERDSVLYLVSHTPTVMYKYDLKESVFIDSIKVNNAVNDGFEVEPFNWKNVSVLITLKEAREYCGGGYIKHYLLDVNSHFQELMSVEDYIDDGGPGGDYSSTVKIVGDTLIYTLEEEQLKVDSVADGITDFHDIELVQSKKIYQWNGERLERLCALDKKKKSIQLSEKQVLSYLECEVQSIIEFEDKESRYSSTIEGIVVSSQDTLLKVYQIGIETCHNFCNTTFESYYSFGNHSELFELETYELGCVDTIYDLGTGTYLLLTAGRIRWGNVCFNGFGAFLVNEINGEVIFSEVKSISQEHKLEEDYFLNFDTRSGMLKYQFSEELLDEYGENPILKTTYGELKFNGLKFD